MIFVPTRQIVLSVNGSTTDRPSLQGARHQWGMVWLRLGSRASARFPVQPATSLGADHVSSTIVIL
jgi:hypothetical protein